MSKRETKISNEILYNWLKDYTVKDLRIFSCIVNRLLSKDKALLNAKDLEEDEEFKYQYSTADEIPEDLFELSISLDFFKEYNQGSNLSQKQIEDIIKRIASLGIWISKGDLLIRKNIIKEIEFNKRYKSMKIAFNESNLKYLIMVYKKFTLINLEDLSRIKSKYELGLYILIKMYAGTGKIIRSLDGIKSFFRIKGTSNDCTKYIEKAIEELNKKFNFKAKIEYEKIDKRIDKITITFRKQVNHAQMFA